MIIGSIHVLLHLGSMKQTLSMLGLKVDWVGNTLHLARPEIYGPQDEKKK